MSEFAVLLRPTQVLQSPSPSIASCSYSSTQALAAADSLRCTLSVAQQLRLLVAIVETHSIRGSAMQTAMLPTRCSSIRWPARCSAQLVWYHARYWYASTTVMIRGTTTVQTQRPIRPLAKQPPYVQICMGRGNPDCCVQPSGLRRRGSPLIAIALPCMAH